MHAFLISPHKPRPVRFTSLLDRGARDSYYGSGGAIAWFLWTEGDQRGQRGQRDQLMVCSTERGSNEYGNAGNSD